MKARSLTLLAIACALSACSPANPPAKSTEAPPPVPVEEPFKLNPNTTTEGAIPDMRQQVDEAMRAFEISGVRIYGQVSLDFPEEFSTLIDATTAAIDSDNIDRDVALAGKNFAVSLREKYVGRMKDAGPEMISALLTARRDLFVGVQKVYGPDACNDMARVDTFADDVLTRVGDVFVPYMTASWSAMKAGVATPRPENAPTRQDVLALASAAINAGGPEAAIQTWVTQNVRVAGQECNLLIALVNAELAMPGQAGERLRAGSTVSLPYTRP